MLNHYSLYLDDIRHPPHTGEDWVLCRTVAGMREVLEAQGIPSLASFDYELGHTDAAHDGYDALMSFLDFLIENAPEEDSIEVEIRLHTSSGYGEARMAQLLKEQFSVCKDVGICLRHMY